jgi:hypothetical protein
MRYVNVWIRAVGVAAVVGLAVSGAAACSGSSESDKPAKSSTASTGAGDAPAETTAATKAAEPTVSASPVLADGRNAVYLTGLNTGAKTVTFDLIEFLTGDAAKAAWKKAHPENPDGPDNDYMIVNNNKKLRTLPVAAEAKCVCLSSLGTTDTKTVGFAALPAYLKEQRKDLTVSPGQIAVLPFWLTVKDGSVVKFEEQFLP